MICRLEERILILGYASRMTDPFTFQRLIIERDMTAFRIIHFPKVIPAKSFGCDEFLIASENANFTAESGAETVHHLQLSLRSTTSKVYLQLQQPERKCFLIYNSSFLWIDSNIISSQTIQRGNQS